MEEEGSGGGRPAPKGAGKKCGSIAQFGAREILHRHIGLLRTSEEVFVHASKRVKVDGLYLDVVSAAASIQDVQLRIVIRDSISVAVLIISVINGILEAR
ncbi:hypothetical protein R1flu_020272 [Riccia fluitans]|uniref:Histone H2A n=1 Tax=Riccia fluitans TaxID=41844 RepID=A0ABD1ZPV0_9MARC